MPATCRARRWSSGSTKSLLAAGSGTASTTTDERSGSWMPWLAIPRPPNESSTDSKRACENKSENIRLVLKGHQRTLMVTRCSSSSRERAGHGSLPDTNGHFRIPLRTYDRLTGGQEVVGSNPASPTTKPQVEPVFRGRLFGFRAPELSLPATQWFSKLTPIRRPPQAHSVGRDIPDEAQGARGARSGNHRGADGEGQRDLG